jgi:hypothetical protein
MRTPHQLSGRGLAPRYILLALLGGVAGVLLSRLLSPVVFERSGAFASLVFAILLVGVVLITPLLWRGGTRS